MATAGDSGLAPRTCRPGRRDWSSRSVVQPGHSGRRRRTLSNRLVARKYVPLCDPQHPRPVAGPHTYISRRFCKGLSRSCSHLIIYGYADLTTSSKLRHAAAHQHKTQLLIVRQSWLDACAAQQERIPESKYTVLATRPQGVSSSRPKVRVKQLVRPFAVCCNGVHVQQRDPFAPRQL